MLLLPAQVIVSEPQGAMLAGDGQLTTGSNSAEQAIPAPVSQPTDCSVSVYQQHQHRQSEVGEAATDNASAFQASAVNECQIETAAGVLPEPQAKPVCHDGSLPMYDPNKAFESTTADGHLSQDSLRAKDSSPPLSSASSPKSDSDNQPSTPTSDASGAAAMAALSQARPSGDDLDQQVAVAALSVLAGVAADPAFAQAPPQIQDDSDLSAQPMHTANEPALVSSSASDSSVDIYGALREDRPHSDDWQVVKSNRKGSAGVIKALADRGLDRSAAPQQQATASRGPERSVEPQLRPQEAGQDAVHMNGDGAHVTKPVRRSSSQASMSSWASVEIIDAADRYSIWHAKQFDVCSCPS